jgi:predicted CoA-binding protein
MINLEDSIGVQLVDPSEKSLKVARERFFQVAQEKDSKKIELRCYRSIDDLSGPIDVAIVATCSDVRSRVIKELTYTKEVRAFILEKVLFQTVAEYFEIDDLLREKGIPTWVNCWMREKDFYKRLKTQMNTDKTIQMKVEGSLWGMGCNCIHFIDLFSFLTACKDFNFLDCRLDEKIIEAKRAGFKEFFGELKGVNSKGHSLELVCRNDHETQQYKIQIINGLQKYEIADHLDHVIHSFFDGNKESIETVEMPFQSQTTHRLVRSIVNEGRCDLTNYRDSMDLHLPLIRLLIGHLQKITGERLKTCPIT